MMIPQINPDDNLKKDYAEFINELRKNIFTGDICTDYATRLSLCVDNSIYQVIPQAVLFPKSLEDIITIMSLAGEERFHSVQFCPRGGGTSTNGQSLSAGIIIDCSRYMRAILEINLDEEWVRVQPGTILDELNAYLKPYGYSFAPEISPSNRATIGGMINTDACGMGSKLLGRTSDHVEGLTCVLASGAVIESSNAIYENTELHEKILTLLEPYTSLIKHKFTSAPRTLNGYNLKKIPQSLNYLFCGSEGTLAVIAECKLKITPIPKYKKLLVLRYRSFDDALRAVELTGAFKPLAVEAIDERLVELARSDSLYFYIQHFIDGDSESTRAINLVEFVSNNETELNHLIEAFSHALEANKNLPGHAFGYYLAKDAFEAKLLWELRKKSVGLISKRTDGTRRPIPFIEDTAVPPESLADYIAEFRTLLDEYNLLYGMYGHVDAGCVHVRPALDMKLSEDENLLKTLTNEVVKLIEKYQGVLWGEHGQGYRSEYAERFFGKELYAVVRQIKTLFDPYNQLNPGKIAIPFDSKDHLVGIEGPFRAGFDKEISESDRLHYADSVICNGNGACFNYSTAEVMCPSYKVTQDRIHSPKGRATLMREWLRQMSLRKVVLNPLKPSHFFSKWLIHFRKQKPDFSQEVYAAMNGCLSCKGCTSQCPLNVDVPDFKAKFYAFYHQRYSRNSRDYLVASLERFAPLQAIWPKLTNAVLKSQLIQSFLHKANLVDTPLIAEVSLKKELKSRKALRCKLNELQRLSDEMKKNSVVILQDAFTSYYEPDILVSLYDLLEKLGFNVYLEAYFPSGKPLHVKGFLRKFHQRVEKNYLRIQSISDTGVPIIGIDPSITLTYRDEYHKTLKTKSPLKVLLIQEWLVGQLPNLPKIKISSEKEFQLISHCTEKTMCVESEKNWETIFDHFGLKLSALSAGCCGMAGSYGHEVEHLHHSKELFEMDWRRHVENHSTTLLATGYSCRSQTKRFGGLKLSHPIEILAKNLSTKEMI